MKSQKITPDFGTVKFYWHLKMLHIAFCFVFPKFWGLRYFFLYFLF